MQEEADRRIGRIADLVHDDGGVIDADLRAGHEADAEQARGAVERRLDHAVEREIGLDLRLVEVVADLAHLLGVEAPVPGLDANRLAARQRQRLERCALLLRPLLRRTPDALQKGGDRRLAAGHGVGQCVVGVARIAVQAGLLEAQVEDLGS